MTAATTPVQPLVRDDQEALPLLKIGTGVQKTEATCFNRGFEPDRKRDAVTGETGTSKRGVMLVGPLSSASRQAWS